MWAYQHSICLRLLLSTIVKATMIDLSELCLTIDCNSIESSLSARGIRDRLDGAITRDSLRAVSGTRLAFAARRCEIRLHCSQTCSFDLLWRIESTPPAYVFGTIHIPANLVWPYVSNETRQAFAGSTHVYGEIDGTSHAYWDRILQCVKNASRRVRRRAGEYSG